MLTGGTIYVNSKGEITSRSTDSVDTEYTVYRDQSLFAPGGEIILNGSKAVFKPTDGEVVSLPTDPVELAAFLTAYFYAKQDTRVFLSWGSAYNLVTEAEMLKMISEGDDALIKIIFENAYNFHKETAALRQRIESALYDAGGDIITTVEDVANSLARAPSGFFEFTTSYVYEPIREALNPNPDKMLEYMQKYPTPFLLIGLSKKYPGISALAVGLLAWTLYNPVKKCCSLFKSMLNYFFRTKKTAPDSILPDMRASTRGGGRTKLIDGTLGSENIICINKSIGLKRVKKGKFYGNTTTDLIDTKKRKRQPGKTEAFEKLFNKISDIDKTKKPKIKGGKSKRNKSIKNRRRTLKKSKKSKK
jgi:hypothetical protein